MIPYVLLFGIAIFLKGRKTAEVDGEVPVPDRDYGAYDYPDSIDDMEAVLWTNEYQTTDRSGSIVVIWGKQQVTYEPLDERRGYYKPKKYLIGNLDRNSWNYDGNRIRTFDTLQAAIDYYDLITDTSGGGSSGGGSSGGFDPESDDDDTDPQPQPQPEDDDDGETVEPTLPVNPGFGFGNYTPKFGVI